MTLPRAVREQAERAEAAQLAFINGNTAPPALMEAPPTADEAPAPVEAPAPTPAPAAPVEPVADSWELKYRVLEGKYRSEVPRMAQEVRELRDQIKALSSAPAPVASPTAVAANGMTHEKVVAQYGEEFASAVQAIAEASVNSVRNEFTQKVDGIEVHTAERARADFVRDLTGLVPNWQSIDAEDGFTAYLNEFDAQTGRTRREFFNEADSSNNAARIATFFAAYARGKQSAAPAPAPAPAAAPSVDHLIAPDSSRRSEAPPGKRLYTRADIGKFYADARQQRYTPAEYQRIDADITAAVAQGRIRG